MTKPLQLLFALLIISSVSSAQFKYGFKIGAGISNIKRPSDNNKVRLSYNLGLQGKINLNKKFSIRPELLFIVKGYSFPSSYISGKGRASFNYIGLPVLATYDLSKTISLKGGFEPAYLISATSRFDGISYNIRYVEKLDLGLVAGIGYNLNERLAFDLRYTGSLLKLYEITVTDQLGNATYKYKTGTNQVVHLSIQIWLDKK